MPGYSGQNRSPSGFFDVICIVAAFLILMGYSAWAQTTQPSSPDEVLVDIMADLYTWNYIETSNPTKRIRLEQALKRLGKEYKCDLLTAQPDLKRQCKPLRRDVVERLIRLYKEEK